MASMKPPAPGEVDTAASGGMAAPGGGGAPAPMSPPTGGSPLPSPDDSPMLTDPTQYPDEPITAGLPIGAGVGPSNMFANDTPSMQRYLPLLRPFLDRPDVPDSVRALYRYIRSS